MGGRGEFVRCGELVHGAKGEGRGWLGGRGVASDGTCASGIRWIDYCLGYSESSSATLCQRRAAQEACTGADRSSRPNRSAPCKLARVFLALDQGARDRGREGLRRRRGATQHAHARDESSCKTHLARNGNADVSRAASSSSTTSCDISAAPPSRRRLPALLTSPPLAPPAIARPAVLTPTASLPAVSPLLRSALAPVLAAHPLPEAARGAPRLAGAEFAPPDECGRCAFLQARLLSS